MILDRIWSNVLQSAEVFSASSGARILMTCILGFSSIFAIRSIASDLLAMHRSKSSLKKIRNNYSFWKKVIMMPAWTECLHATSFCHFIIVVHHLRAILLFFILLLELLSCCFAELNLMASFCTRSVTAFVDVPILLMHLSLDRYPFHKHKHEYRFIKYNRTSERKKLF